MYEVYLLIGQRKEAYEGQYAPETLEVADWHTFEDGNPEWLWDKKKEYEDTKEFVSLKIFKVDIGSQNYIRNLLLNVKKISAKSLTAVDD